MLIASTLKYKLIIFCLLISYSKILSQIPIEKLSDKGYKNIVFRESKKNSKIIFDDSAKILKDLTEIFHNEKSFLMETNNEKHNTYISSLFIITLDKGQIKINLPPNNNDKFEKICLDFLRHKFTKYQISKKNCKANIGIYIAYNTSCKELLVNIVEVSGKKYYPIYKSTRHDWSSYMEE